MTSHETTFIYIIESPSDKDLLDGRTEGRTLCESLQLANICNWYSLVTSKKMFHMALTDRLDEAIEKFPNKVPILHLSMHGFKDGIELTNGDCISWEELRQSLAPLNSSMPEPGLMVCMSTCHGASGLRMAWVEDSIRPFWALVGNAKSPNWDDAAVAYVTFYHQLFKTEIVEAAVIAMNIASGDGNFLYFSGDKEKENWANKYGRTTK